MLYPEHMSELTTLSNVSKAFPAGKSLRVRVLRVDAAHHTVVCTNKRSLLREDAPILCDLSTAERNKEYVGVVSDLRPVGVMVRFFGDICGMVPSYELQRRNLKAEDLYKKGRVVRVRLLSVDAKANRCQLVPVESGSAPDQAVLVRVRRRREL